MSRSSGKVKSENLMNSQKKSGTGANMLPPFCPADAPPGERELFRMLKEDPHTAGWTILHSLDIAKHIRAAQGEADFVVLIPDEGILVIEVKSHNSVRYDNSGWWLGGKNESRGPYKQASEALHSIRKYLEQRDLSHSVPMISAVIFTSAPFQITSSEWHIWQTLDKQSLHARPISTSLITIIQKARQYYSTKNLAWMRDGVDAPREKLNRIVQALRPRFEILASPAERRKQLEDGLRQCTEQQFRILDDASINRRLLVSGLAGTGKTTLAVEVVRREKSENPESVIGFFCFNKHLGVVLAKECSAIAEGIRLGSFHSWMLEFSGIKPSAEQIRDPAFWNRTLPEQCIGKLTAPGMPPGFLDLLVLDEAQDLFLDPYLDIFDLLLKGGLKKGRWRLFGDFDRQDIYAQGAVTMDAYYQDRVDERCAIQRLSENCRNTQEISAALTLHTRLKPGYSRTLREDTRHDPDLLFYENQEEQIKHVTSLLDGYLAEGFKASEIVLLSPQRYACLAYALNKKPERQGRVKEYSIKQQKLAYSTIHAFKGLEAPVVILTDICSLETSRDYDLLYVGMSRALHRLALICKNPLQQKIKESCFS